MHDAGGQGLSAIALPIREVAFPVQVQLASSDPQFQRGVEDQASDFGLPPDRNNRTAEQDAQDAKPE